MGELVIGVDLGGTKIEAVVAHRELTLGTLEVISRRRVPTNSERGYQAVINATVQVIEEAARDQGLDLDEVPIGLGMPGSTTHGQGLIKNCNATCLNGRPFHVDLEDALGARTVAFGNDANLFALAEVRLGAARSFHEGLVFGVIMGSGVGGGIVIDGEVWEGAQRIAGEWGHQRVFSGAEARSCYCGGWGCLEAHLSGPAVEDAYEKRSGTRRPLARIAEVRDQDPHADAVLEDMIVAFAKGLANVVNILDPNVIVLGGGVSNLDLFYDEATRRVSQYVFNEALYTPILKHALGDSAGVLGAALIAARGRSE